MSRLRLILLLISVVTLSCKDENTDPKPSENYFVSVTKTQETSLFLLKIAASQVGQSEIIPMLKYDITTYKLVYRTTYNGKKINASGLIFVPKNTKEEAPILSIQHGTTFVKNDAPSVAGDFTGTEFFASAGYLTLMPDFIGYGESASVFHPYYDKEHSARAVIDMIKAAKEYFSKEEIAFSDKLFLAGYSEGGYVTLSTANVLETTPSEDLPVTAVAAGAGGYDLEEMLSGITTTHYYSYPSYLAFMIMSYNTTYEWNKPLTYFFNQPYADVLSQYMNGQYDGSFVNSKLTTNADQLFDAQFFGQLKPPAQEQLLLPALTMNSITGWSTQTPIRLYHGTKDEVIPYHNSETTLQKFKAAGSTGISLTPIADGTHSSSFIPMLKDVIPWFETLR